MNLAHGLERASAFLIDLTIVAVVLAAASFAASSVLTPMLGGAMSGALVSLLSFFLRCPYFVAFELGWRGQTPGKRGLGLRVIDRQGGALPPAAVVARNILREVEVFMPLTLLLGPDPGGGPLLYYSASAWLGILLLMPFFNRDRMRVGDMVAGTLVVSAGRVSLHRDPAESTRATDSAPAPTVPRYRFTPAQLDAYGIAELQVLEGVLRRRSPKVRTEVCNRIRRKIAWKGEPVEAEQFLSDYYTALRAHLERHALFGDRRHDKREMASRREGGAPRRD